MAVALGPDLSSIGRWTAQALRETILNPNQREGRERNVVIVKTRDGREIRGLRRNEDSFSLQLIDTAEKFHLLDKKDLAGVRYEEKSLMPDDYGRRLSPAEVDNTVAYLKTLRVRDLAKAAAVPITGGLDYDRIRHASREPQNWFTYWGDYQGRHYSALKQITTENVDRLQTRWAFQVPGRRAARGYSAGCRRRHVHHRSAGPCVRARCPFGPHCSGSISARRKAINPYDAAKVNRGVAMLGGRVFFTTTGCATWWHSTPRAVFRFGSRRWPITCKASAARWRRSRLRDRIIAGISGAEFGVRGFIDAYDPASGKRLWRFYSIPGPGEFGNNTWEGDSWSRGGASTWMTGTYDPDSDTLYWGIGNPGSGSQRRCAQGRQSVQLFSGRARSEHGPAQVAFSIHPARRSRLGFD